MAFCNDLEDINSVCMTAVAVCSRNPKPWAPNHYHQPINPQPPNITCERRGNNLKVLITFP